LDQNIEQTAAEGLLALYRHCLFDEYVEVLKKEENEDELVLI
jgi:hypothetical protein